MEWAIQIDNQVQALDWEQERPQRASIYEIPSVISNQNQEAYVPQMVSFGPYHHGKQTLGAMEKHKERALIHFLNRSVVTLQSIFHSLRDEAQKLKDTYESLDVSWHNDTERFLQLMVVDGCFMLEILYFATQPASDYPNNDPVFSTHGKVYVLPFIRRDMSLLENQLPMLVLIKLWDATNKFDSEDEVVKSLNKLILGLCNPAAKHRNLGKCLHVLDLHRKSLLGKTHSNNVAQPRTKKHVRDPRFHHKDENIVRSVTELQFAGIIFKKRPIGFLDDISFKDGILELPSFVVDDMTKSTFLNLVAFERCHVDAGHDITAFIYFMDNIVKDEHDISPLCSVGILQNCIGSDKKVAKLFNTMAKDQITYPSGKLKEVREKVDEYCELPWNRWRAELMSTYLRSPWDPSTILTAILAFGLTVVQTAYSILQYEQGKRSH